MERLGVTVELSDASLLEIPFAADEFNALVCLSVLEHITELDAAFEEFVRVLRPGGVAVIGFPVRNPVTDALFRMLGFDPREIHPSSHSDIIRAAQRSTALRAERFAQVPPLMPRSLSAYVAARLRAV
jgi:2-polyprenyl-6-hydroxyphenyl methylase/3-demethylubiquinone-9 3-methyltransferase